MNPYRKAREGRVLTPLDRVVVEWATFTALAYLCAVAGMFCLALGAARLVEYAAPHITREQWGIIQPFVLAYALFYVARGLAGVRR